MIFTELQSQIFLSIMLVVILGCTENEIKKGDGYATPSYGSKELKFETNFQVGDRPNSINLKLTHYSDNGLLNVIHMVNIPKSNDTTFLTQFKEIPNMPIDTFRSEFLVQVDEDAIGEYYLVDTSIVNPTSYVVLNDINSRRISGSFQINFVLSSEITFPKLDETIPDTFNVSNGSFSAEKFR
jgi:hypothetical protein